MRKLIMTALFAVLAFGAFAGTAAAATITAEPLGAEVLNISVSGLITFDSPVATIICPKTMFGHLNPTSTGTLSLLGNEAGTIRDVRLGTCTGGNAIPLIKLERAETWVRLSWLRAEPARTPAGRAQLTGNNAAFQIEIELGRCLYDAELIAESTAREERYTRLDLRLLSERSIVLLRDDAFGFCPRREIRMTGALVALRPTALRIILR